MPMRSKPPATTAKGHRGRPCPDSAGTGSSKTGVVVIVGVLAGAGTTVAAVSVGEAVGVGECVGVAVADGVPVGVFVRVGDGVPVGVKVCVGVGETETVPSVGVGDATMAGVGVGVGGTGVGVGGAGVGGAGVGVGGAGVGDGVGGAGVGVKVGVGTVCLVILCLGAAHITGPNASTMVNKRNVAKRNRPGRLTPLGIFRITGLLVHFRIPPQSNSTRMERSELNAKAYSTTPLLTLAPAGSMRAGSAPPGNFILTVTGR